MVESKEILFADENNKKVKSGFVFFLIVFLYIIEIIIACLFFYLALRSMASGLAIIVSSIPLIVIIIVQRLSPVVAIILFLFKKREGWISVVFLNIINLLLNGIQIAQWLPLFHSPNKAIRIILMSHTITLVISMIISFLIFLRPIVTQFSVTNKIKLQTIIAAIIITFLLKYFIADFVMKVPSPF
jgi:hypothetical protein